MAGFQIVEFEITTKGNLSMRKLFRSMAICCAALAALAISSSHASASIVFSDNFNGENFGNGALDFNTFTQWTVTGGTVDLIGNGYFDYFPGHGLYVDLDGSTHQAGLLSTQVSFGPGSYVLKFDLGGNHVNGYSLTDTVIVTLGSFTTSVTRGTADPLTAVINVFSTTGGVLSFQNSPGGDNVGPILDNVVLKSVPEPSSMALAGLGGLGLAIGAYRRRQQKAAA